MENAAIIDYLSKNYRNISDDFFSIVIQDIPEESLSPLLLTRLHLIKEKENDNQRHAVVEEVVCKNESIRSLLTSFANPHGRKGVHARSELKKRFPYLDYSDQRKIIDAFVKKGRQIDMIWVAKYLLHDIYWKDDYLNAVIKAWEHELDNWWLTKLMVLRAPSDYLRDFVSRYSACKADFGNVKKFRYDLFATRLGLEDTSFVIDKSLFSPMQYVFCCAKLNRKITHEEAAAGFYDCIFTALNQFGWHFCIMNEVWDFKKVTFFFTCLRNWGMMREIMEFNDWILLVSKVLAQKMHERGNKNDEWLYKIYLQRSLLPKYFPEEYGVPSLCPFEYKAIEQSFDEWKISYNHQGISFYLIDKTLVDVDVLAARKQSANITETFDENVVEDSFNNFYVCDGYGRINTGLVENTSFDLSDIPDGLPF